MMTCRSNSPRTFSEPCLTGMHVDVLFLGVKSDVLLRALLFGSSYSPPLFRPEPFMAADVG